MSACRWVVFSSVISCLVASNLAYAAPFRPTPEEVFSIHSDQRFRCALVDGQWVFGRYNEKRGVFRTFAAERRSLRAKIATASDTKKLKLRRDLKDLRVARSEVGEGCAAGPRGNDPDPTPTPTPTPFPEELSLLPLSRPMTVEDIRYLTEKAGYGMGNQEQPLLALAGQGVAAAVSAFITEQPDEQALIDRVQDRFDGTLGNGVGPLTNESITGYERALLEHAVGTRNAFHDHLTHFFSALFTAGCDELVNLGNGNAPQIPLCWDYITLLRNIARNPVLPQSLVTVGRHPVMLLYLDNDSNLKDQPNENYARELKELFSLSPSRIENGVEVPNYVEERGDGDRTRGDIFRAARALTGWRLAQLAGPGGQQVWRAVFSPEDHAQGPHLMFEGTPYAFNAENDEQLVQGIFAHHPGAAPYFATELLEWYLTPNPPAELVQQLAGIIKANNFDLGEPIRILLSSSAFYHTNYKNTVIKTPFKLAVEFVRILGLSPNLTGPANQERGIHINNRSANLRDQNGQSFSVTLPPSVFWHSNQKLMSASSLRGNTDFMAAVLSDTTVQNNNGFTLGSVLPGAGATAEQVIDYVAARMGVTLNTSQRTQLLFFMNNVPRAGGGYNARAYNHANTTHQRDKALVLYLIIGMLPQFALG